MQEQRAGIRLAQLRLYVANHFHDRFLAPPLTLLVAGLLTHWVPAWQAALWCVVELGCIACYIGVYRRFLGSGASPGDEHLWRRRIGAAHGLHMLMWSSLVVWALLPGDFSSLMFLMLVHVGLISLTVTMGNAHLALLRQDLVFPTLALLAPPLLEPNWLDGGVALACGLYILLMLRVAREINNSTTEGLILREHNERLIEELERQASRDSLTGLPNRRYFLEAAEVALERACSDDAALALLMVDIDHFKPVNDQYGHLAGDTVLVAVAQACSASLRDGDCLGRLGGEEFALVLPETTAAAARDMAERLRTAVAALDVVVPGGHVPPTVSVGVTLREAGDTRLSSLLHRADLAMYEAKSAGRNRVCLAPAMNPAPPAATPETET